MDNIVAVITVINSIIGSIALILTIKVTIKIHKTQTILSQRQIIIPIWEFIMQLKRPIEGDKKADWNEVIALSNRLELLSLCWEGGVIDENIIRGSLSETFVELWDGILDYETIIEGEKRRGRDLVKYNKSAQRTYEKLKKENLERDKVQPIRS